MPSCVAFFVLGFLTDKIRLFPFLMGIILGVILKSLIENPCMLDDNQNLATRVYDTMKSPFVTAIGKDPP